jgi:glyoxylase-like metal-dependent hydrolase (beta-lactamase superfamily II)
LVVGDIELVALVDATGELGELAELFPKTTDWNVYEDAYPELFKGAAFRVPSTCYLLRTADTTVLVDTGVGPAGLWDWPAETEEGLPRALGDAGVAPEDIDTVFLTHLHVDHVGWNTDRDGRPFFPDARYVVHREALAFVRDDGQRPHAARTIAPVDFEQIDGETELAPGITAFPLPGHYPGHMGVRIESGGETALLIADAAVHPMLLDRPRDVYAFDVDQVTSAATREALVSSLVDQDLLVGCGHYPGGGIGCVVGRDGHVLWTEAA